MLSACAADTTTPITSSFTRFKVLGLGFSFVMKDIDVNRVRCWHTPNHEILYQV
jgi:hypothetical protein